MLRKILISTALLLCAYTNTYADESTESLAKASQNPVADLISLPFQDNINFGVGPYKKTQNVLNIQPVIPVHLNQEWNLIARVITPVIHQPQLTPNDGSVNGLGDINPTLFLSPRAPGKLIWGVGPTFLFPSASNRILGQGKWGIGPSAVAVIMPSSWVIGALANNIWSVAGQSNRPNVNQFLLQYFVNYNMPSGWFLTSSPIVTANWMAKAGDVWTIPVGLGAGRVFKIGTQAMSVSGQGIYNVWRPHDAALWTLRLQATFLFPT